MWGVISHFWRVLFTGNPEAETHIAAQRQGAQLKTSAAANLTRDLSREYLALRDRHAG